MVREKPQIINYFEQEDCSYCGTRDTGLSEHHLIRRSERPDLIKDKENKVWLCWKCHHKAETDVNFYKKLQEIFLSKKYLKKVNYKIWPTKKPMTQLQKLLEALKKRSCKK